MHTHRNEIHSDVKIKISLNPKSRKSTSYVITTFLEETCINPWHQGEIFYEETGGRNSALFYELWKVSFY